VDPAGARVPGRRRPAGLLVFDVELIEIKKQ